MSNLDQTFKICLFATSNMILDNDRGIFILMVLKKILDKLLYFDNYMNIDEDMSDSNIGARRNRSIKDHLFIIHGIVNSVVKGKEDSIYIQVFDLEKVFDALWLEDSLYDIVDALPEEKKMIKYLCFMKQTRQIW